ncbi:MAG: hypothetical protein AB7F22_10365 [Reyranella sp.]|uniref:hypothetical protein n=1 Tax=Reyranella sp. TaxID=1929291 RepID=UPI003D109FD3
MMTATFTPREKMRAAQREAGYRRGVYRRRVAEGHMTEAEMARGIAIMDEIAADYGAVAEREEQAGRLL